MAGVCAPGSRRRSRFRQGPRPFGVPRLHPAHDFRAGAPGIENLVQESPEREAQGKGSPTAVETFGGGREKIQGQPRAEQLAQSAQRFLPQLLDLLAHSLASGTALATAEVRGNTGQKGSLISHAQE